MFPYFQPSKVDENDPFNFPFNVDLEFLYNSWSQWTQCSKTCGEGIRQRKRTCINKEFVCRGEVIPQQFCNVDPCPGSYLSFSSKLIHE